VLRDVLDWSAAEAAELLETSVAAVNSALQRARATLETRRDRLEGVVSLDPDDDRTQALLRRYVDAWDSSDAASLATLLRDDAELTMPPVPTWLRGRDAIASFLGAMLPSMGRFTARAVPVSGGLGVATWLLAPGNERPVAQAIHALASDASGRLSRLDVFMDTSLFARFDLPGSL
jgi:RNA polymerase sigma-70 factor, ECF subfamily